MLTIEDGSIVEGADSYLSVAQAIGILANFGYSNLSTIANVSQQEACLRLASESADRTFMSHPTGYPVDVNVQVFAFPRNYVYIKCKLMDNDVIPETMLRLTAIDAEIQSYRFSNAISGDEPAPQGIKKIRRASRAEVEFFETGSRLSQAEQSLYCLRASVASDLPTGPASIIL